jgi:multidrug efflux pump subunit AcrA (membrane-fusion protein)
MIMIKPSVTTLMTLLLFTIGNVQASSIITVESKGSSARTVLGSTVIPYKEVTLTAQVPGRIDVVSGDVGSMFSAGDLLVKVNDDSLQAQRRSVLASLDSAKAALSNSEVQYQREVVSPRSKDITGMPGMGMPAMMDIYMTRPFMSEMLGDSDDDYNRYSDLLNKSTGVAQAKSNVMKSWSSLNAIDAQLKNAISTAPFEGMVLKKMVEVGDTVQPGQPLVKFGYVKYKRLRADVPSILVQSLRKDMEVPVVINGTIKTNAKVSQIYPIADAARHTVTVKFDLYTDVKASPGMYAEIYLPDTGNKGSTILVVPQTVLLKGRSLPSVLVLNEKGKSELRLVRLGNTQGKENIEVVSGLSAGDQVINNPPTDAVSGFMPLND